MKSVPSRLVTKLLGPILTTFALSPEWMSRSFRPVAIVAQATPLGLSQIDPLLVVL